MKREETKELRKKIDLDKYKLTFCNLEGKKEADGISIKALRDAFHHKLVAQFNKTITRYKKRYGEWEEDGDRETTPLVVTPGRAPGSQAAATRTPARLD